MSPASATNYFMFQELALSSCKYGKLGIADVFSKVVDNVHMDLHHF
jgi:hypothetical protein